MRGADNPHSAMKHTCGLIYSPDNPNWPTALFEWNAESKLPIDLRPENPSYPTIIATGDEIERTALAVERRPRLWCPAKETRRASDE